MNRTAQIDPPPPGHSQRVSTRIAFFIAGFGMAAWAPLVPYAKARLGIGAGTLGLLLLCVGGGLLSTAPFAGQLTARFGCRRMIWLASLGLCACLPLLARAATPPLLALGLLIFGGSLSLLDIAMNIQAVIVERASARPLMSGFHGLFSAGGITGAAGVSLLLWAGITPLPAVICVVLVILGLLLAFARHLLPYGSTGITPLFVRPRGLVLLIGLLCFILFLAEGAMLDWSAVFLATVRHVEPSRAGLGYAVFSVAMTSGRLNGDRLVRRIGARPTLALGPLCAALGLVLAVLVPWPAASFLSFGLVGLGAANAVPVLYSAIGRQKAMPANLAISTVATLGYTGILAGPALIGFIAHATSLEGAFLLLAGMLLLVAASARLVV
jgi:predicted MFS family arabinose efflux permease